MKLSKRINEASVDKYLGGWPLKRVMAIRLSCAIGLVKV